MRKNTGGNHAIIRGEITYEKLPSGATLMRSAEFPPRPETELRSVADAIRLRLADATRPD